MDHFLFMFRICHVLLSVHCNLVVTCWERANPLALLYFTFYFVFVTFPCGVLGQVWCLIVSIHDLFLLSYFYYLYMYMLPLLLSHIVSFEAAKYI